MTLFFWLGLLVLAVVFGRRWARDRRAQESLPVSSERLLTSTRPVWVRLESVTRITPNTCLYRFKLPKEDMILGVPPGKHVCLHAPNPLYLRAKKAGQPISTMRWNGRPTVELEETVVRRYGPIQDPEAQGHFLLIIKMYEKCRKFPDGGMMTGYLASREIGDSIQVSGPHGRIEYLGMGSVMSPGRRILQSNTMCMVYGGTGLTPGYMLCKRILSNPEDKTKVHMIYANQRVSDIILRDQLEEWAQKFPDRFKLLLVVTTAQPSDNWQGQTGIVNKQMMKDFFPPFTPETLVCLVGPASFVSACVRPALRDLNYDLSRVLPL